jgi:hypothetical protein
MYACIYAQKTMDTVSVLFPFDFSHLFCLSSPVSLFSVHYKTQHARRLFPLRVLPKDKVEFGYQDRNALIAMNNDAAKDAPEGIEKKIGFKGKPDVVSGFYCRQAADTQRDESSASPNKGK